MSQLKAQVAKLLTGASVRYSPENYICDRTLPLISVDQSTGLLGKYGTGHLRIENTVIAGRGKYRRVEPMTTSTDSFHVKGHGLEGHVSAEDYENFDDPFDAERDETISLTDLIHIEKEYLLATTLGNSAILTQGETLSGVAQWNSNLTSDPLDTVKTAFSTIIDGCGKAPDTGICDIKVINELRFHPALLSRLGFAANRAGGLSIEELKMAMGLRKLLVTDARYESANQGQTSSLAAVFGKNFVFAVLPDQAQVRQVSLGYMIRNRKSGPRNVYKQPTFNPPNGMDILVEDKYDMLISNPLAAYLVKAVIA